MIVGTIGINPEEKKEDIEIDSILYNKVKKQVYDKVKGIGISKHTLHSFLQIIIEVVETTSVKGKTKKQLALNIMRDLVSSSSKSDEKEFILELLDNGTISNMIDLIISATRGELNLNKVIQVSTKCCYGFLNKK